MTRYSTFQLAVAHGLSVALAVSVLAAQAPPTDLLRQTLAAVLPKLERTVGTAPLLIIPGKASSMVDSIDRAGVQAALGARARIPAKDEDILECTGTKGAPGYWCQFKGNAIRLMVSDVKRTVDSVTVLVSAGWILRQPSPHSGFVDYEVTFGVRNGVLGPATVKLLRQS